jgi:predicted transcriptional regulator
MSTTTIRIPDDLKSRVADAAERAGTTPHSFILEAIKEKAEENEKFSDFRNVAETRFAALAASGETIPWEKMRHYLEERVEGKRARRPRADKLNPCE